MKYKKIEITLFALIISIIFFPNILKSQVQYNLQGYIDNNIRDEHFVDEKGNHVSVKIYKDADKVGTKRIINGLKDYDKRMQLYRDVITNLILQPSCQSVDLIVEGAETGVEKSELFAQASILYETGSFSLGLLEFIAQHSNLMYIAGTNQTNQLINSWKHLLRHVRHSNLHNLNNALSAISLIMNVIEMGDRIAIISSNYVLLKALELDLSTRRLDILENYCKIDDDAFNEAIYIVRNNIDVIPTSDWSRIILTLQSQALEVENLVITLGHSLNSLGTLLSNMPKPSPISGWIFAALFTWQTGVMIQEHKDHMRISSLAATIYANLEYPVQDRKIYEISEYAQYLFVDEFRLAFDNWAVEILSWFNSSWNEVKTSWTNMSNDILYKIRLIRTSEAMDYYNAVVNNETPDNLVFVQGGTFQMGSNDGCLNESPIHSVTVDDFYIGKYEVTHKEYIEFLNAKGVSFDGSYNGTKWIYMDSECCAIGYRNGKFYFKSSRSVEDINCPVIFVTWYGAKAYCEWKGGRLPTEAEWEYAARGGNNSNGYKYSGSNNFGDVGWYWDNSGSKTHPVGQKKPNELDIYDMSGNVMEWCWDWYGSSYYQECYNQGTVTNPKGPDRGLLNITYIYSAIHRILRGGSWCGNGGSCRVSDRTYHPPGSSYAGLGFRFSRTP